MTSTKDLIAQLKEAMDVNASELHAKIDGLEDLDDILNTVNFMWREKRDQLLTALEDAEKRAEAGERLKIILEKHGHGCIRSERGKGDCGVCKILSDYV